jgi:hypothetical protein
LSYFGDSTFIKNKLENFSHQEYNSDTYTNLDKISEKINNGLDLFNRDQNNISNSIQKIPINDNLYLPPLYDTYLKEFYDNPKPKIFCFIHSCTCSKNGTKMLDYIINVIEKTGFIDVVDHIFIINIGIPINNKYGNDKYLITNYSENTNYYEAPTLNKLIDFSKENPNNYALYLHTKGISFDMDAPQFKSIFDWINLMLYFLVEKHDDCINKLNEAYDTVGCNYYDKNIQNNKHYSGNFWWGKTNFLKKINCLNEKAYDKAICEFLVFTNEHRHYTMYNSNINHYHECYPIAKYSQDSIINNININNINKQPLKVLNQTLKNITIGFHSNQLCERGTEVAMYDYAYYNQKLYGNKSIIFYCKHSLNNDSNVITKFEKEFKCYAYDNFSDIDKFILDEKIDYFYNIKGGEKSDNQLVTKCPNLIHAVFTVEPYGDKYATISKQLSLKYNNIVDHVPHMINLPECSKNMKIQLNIPENAIVLGRIGGFYQFDLKISHNAIKQIVDIDSNIFFLFVNTNKFYEHPQIIYLNKIIDPIEKVKFINTCDAMIHARSDGETFGLAVAEFSSLNKPVITSVSNMDNSHIEILGSKGIIYDTEDSLMEIFKNIRTIIKSKDDWNAYKEYTPEIVMKQFMDVFIPNDIKQILFDNF